jgi:hypothetical protein
MIQESWPKRDIAIGKRSHATMIHTCFDSNFVDSSKNNQRLFKCYYKAIPLSGFARGLPALLQTSSALDE